MKRVAEDTGAGAPPEGRRRTNWDVGAPDGHTSVAASAVATGQPSGIPPAAAAHLSTSFTSPDAGLYQPSPVAAQQQLMGCPGGLGPAVVGQPSMAFTSPAGSQQYMGQCAVAGLPGGGPQLGTGQPAMSFDASIVGQQFPAGQPGLGPGIGYSAGMAGQLPMGLPGQAFGQQQLAGSPAGPMAPIIGQPHMQPVAGYPLDMQSVAAGQQPMGQPAPGYPGGLPGQEWAAQGGQLVAGHSMGAGHSGSHQGKEPTFVLQVDKKEIGYVIGRGGENIKNIRQLSQCDILIDTPENTSSTVRIFGPLPNAEMAKGMILAKAGELGVAPASLAHGPHDEVRIEQSAVGYVIGKAGETMKSFRMASGAFITVDQSTKDEGYTIVRIMGSEESVRKAKELVQAKIAEVHGQTAEGCQSPAFEVKIPQPSIGAIIGKGGCTLKTLREESGSQIVIDQSTKELGYSTLRILQGPGAAAGQMLVEAKLREIEAKGQGKGQGQQVGGCPASAGSTWQAALTAGWTPHPGGGAPAAPTIGRVVPPPTGRTVPPPSSLLPQAPQAGSWLTSMASGCGMPPGGFAEEQDEQWTWATSVS